MEICNIKITKSIVHILNSKKDEFILSSKLIYYEPDFQETLKKYIMQIMSGDDVKNCIFRESSEVEQILKSEKDFVFMSQLIATELYKHMKKHEGIPSADLIILQFEYKDMNWLALLKMNYISTYTHNTKDEINQIIIHGNVFPKTENIKLKEAAIINMDDYRLKVLEKKFEVNDIKANYFSGLFLKCRGQISEKSKLQVVRNSLDLVKDKYFKQETQKAKYLIQSKAFIASLYEERGVIDTSLLSEELFKENLEGKEEFIKLLEKYELNNKKIMPKNEETVNKVSKHKVVTDTGIEILIPMKCSNDQNIEFRQRGKGKITIILKNIQSIRNL